MFMCIYKMFSPHHVSQVRNPFCFVLFSSQKPIVHRSVQWNALPYIGKFDSQAAFGIYGLAATCRQNNTNQTLQPVALNINTAHTAANLRLRLRLIYSCGQSTVTANLWLRPIWLWLIYGYGQSTVMANLWLRPIYGCSQFTVTANLWLRPIYGCGQSTVVVDLPLQSIYGYGQSTVEVNLWLRPIYFVSTASLPITVTVLLYLDYMHYQSATLVQ